jgi:hypothetical protein
MAASFTPLSAMEVRSASAFFSSYGVFALNIVGSEQFIQ